MFRNGEMVKKEYRGQRSADALAEFVRSQLKESVVEHQKLESLDELEVRVWIYCLMFITLVGSYF